MNLARAAAAGRRPRRSRAGAAAQLSRGAPGLRRHPQDRRRHRAGRVPARPAGERGPAWSGGFNVYPREVEDVLYAHPAVAEAAVVGMRDPLLGEDVLAFVVLKAGATAEASALIAFCQARKTPIGKILRKELRGPA